MTSSCPVGTARSRPSASASMRFSTTRRPSTRPSSSPITSTGERRKRSSMRCVLPLGSRARVLAQDLHPPVVGLRGRVGLEPGGAGRIELELGGVDDDVGAAQLAELEQLRVGERGLGRAAAAEQGHVAHLRALEHLDGVVGGVGRAELVGIEHEHAPDVDGDVAVADHDRALGVEVELVVGVVRMAVVPGDELRGRVRARPVLAGDPEPVVGGRADRVDERVVALAQLVGGHVLAEADRAEEAEARALRGLLVDPRDRLDLRVVGGDAGAHEPERRGQGVDQVDLPALGEQLVGAVEAGRAGADHGGAQGLIGGAHPPRRYEGRRGLPGSRRGRVGRSGRAAAACSRARSRSSERPTS